MRHSPTSPLKLFARLQASGKYCCAENPRAENEFPSFRSLRALECHAGLATLNPGSRLSVANDEAGNSRGTAPRGSTRVQTRSVSHARGQRFESSSAHYLNHTITVSGMQVERYARVGR